MKSPWLFSTIILLLITAALADPVVHDDATTKRQLEFLQKHPYLFPPKEHRSYQEIKRRLGELATVSAPDEQVTTDPNSHASDETRLLTEDKPDPLEEKRKEYEAAYQEIKRRLGELETVSAPDKQVTTDTNSHENDEIRLLTEDKPDPLEGILKVYEAAYQEIYGRLGELEAVSAPDKQATTDPNLHASDETGLLTEDKPDRLEEILKEYEAGVYETDDLVVSMLCEGDAASTEKFKCAWDKVEYLLSKDLEATTRRRRLSCCSFRPKRKYCDEYQCWRKNFGPHFEHRVRVFHVVRLARYHARRAGRPADDYEGMKSSLCPNVFSTEKVERAAKVAQQTAILANAVRYHMVQVLRLLLEEGSRRRLLENESPYEEHYFRILVKEAARGDDLQILEMLLKFSDAPENFGAALLAAVSPGRKKNGQIIHFLLSHEGSMDEALKLAWFKDMVTELEKVQEIYDTYRDSE